MQVKTIVPIHTLESFVRNIYVIKSGDFPDLKMDLFPDGCPGIIYQQAGGEVYLDKQKKELSPFFIHGQTIKPAQLILRGNKPIIIFQLYPHVTKALFGFNSKELTNDCLDLNLLSFVAKTNLVDQLMETGETEEQVNLISDFLIGHIRKNEIDVENMLHFAIGKIIHDKGQIQIREIRETLGVPKRTLERKFENHVGVSPKLFARISQFQASLGQLKMQNFDKLSDVAIDNGYADQSHFIRSFREFTGYSPNEFVKSANLPSIS